MNWLIFCHDFHNYLNLYNNFKNKKKISNQFFFVKENKETQK